MVSVCVIPAGQFRWRGFRTLTDASAGGYTSRASPTSAAHGGALASGETIGLSAGARSLVRRWRLIAGIVSGCLLACLMYCLFVPKEYEARARVAVRVGSLSSLRMEDDGQSGPSSMTAVLVQLETLADVFRSDELAWRVILEDKLYRSPAFSSRFSSKFPRFNPEAPSAQEQAYLLERFKDRLQVRTIPRTVLLEIHFHCENPILSAKVVNDLLRMHDEQIESARREATRLAVDKLNAQLAVLGLQVNREREGVLLFQKQKGILVEADAAGAEATKTVQHIPVVAAVDGIGHELVAAVSDRIAREARYRIASEGDPEMAMAAEPSSAQPDGGASGAIIRQLRLHRSELDQEKAQLDLEHGPSFPRVLEIAQQVQDLDRQLAIEDQRVRQLYRSAWLAAVDREEKLRKQLDIQMGQGLQANEAAMRSDELRRQADMSEQLLLKARARIDQADLVASIPSPDFWLVDAARPPAKPSWPNVPLIIALTLFVSAWISAAVVFVLDFMRPSGAIVSALLLVTVMSVSTVHAQAPTPSTSGLPAGVAHIPQTSDARVLPNAKEAPPVWGGNDPARQSANPSLTDHSFNVSSSPIGPGDTLDVREFHTSSVQSTVRVAPDGTISVPMVGRVEVAGMLEAEAARAIETALISKGILRHPQVSVLVLSAVGQDVSVLGEVNRPGVYAYGAHHRLLDLIASAAGMTIAAGSVAYVFSRDDPGTPHTVVLDRATSGAAPEHNPELMPGDTVQISRAGLIYVVGDVLRPGGFTVEPGDKMTVLQAVSLAWGPSQNASMKNIVLIREQAGGRTVTSLNLKRMLRGQDPDVPVRERDVLFVPNSTAKNLWNRTLESVVQSTAGVSIYAGMVYSQRF